MSHRSGFRVVAALALAPFVLVPIACMPSVSSPLAGTWGAPVGGLPKDGWFSEGDPQRLAKIATLIPINDPTIFKVQFGLSLTLNQDGTFQQDITSSSVTIRSVGRYSVAGNRFQMTCTDLQVNRKSVKPSVPAALASPFNPAGTFKREKDGTLILTMNGSDLKLSTDQHP